MEHLDGNAAAGELSEVFALDVTTAVATCAGCGMTGAGRAGDGLRGRHGHRAALPGVRRRAAAARPRAGRELRVEMRGVRLLRWRSAGR